MSRPRVDASRACRWAIALVVAAVPFAVDCAESDAGTLHDGFESPALRDVWRTDKLAPGALRLQSERVRAGRSAVELTLRPGDPSPKVAAGPTERDELQEVDALNRPEGEAYACGFSLFLPTDFPIVSNRLVLAQWKQDAHRWPVTVDNPVVALRYVGGELAITVQHDADKTPRFRRKAEFRGRWLDFVFHLRHSRKPDDGFVRVWLDGEQILDFRGATAYGEDSGYQPRGTFYFKMGLYRDDFAEPMTLFIDEYWKRPLRPDELP